MRALFLVLSLVAACNPPPAPDVPVATPAWPASLSPCRIQGAGPRSSRVGREVTTEGVVIGVGRGEGSPGYFLQMPGCDDDPATSDALFVRVEDGGLPGVGSWLKAAGTVRESYGRTELVEARRETLAESAPLPLPRPLLPLAEPDAANAAHEALEAMRVRVDHAAVTGPTSRFGEAAILVGAPPGTRLFADGPLGRRLMVVISEPIAFGATVRDLVGPLDYTFGRFKIVPEGTLTVTAPRPNPPDPIPTLETGWRLASLNVERLTADDPRLEVFATLIADRLGAPDIVALQEIVGESALTALADHPLLKAVGYAGLVGSVAEADDPRLGLLVRADRLRIVSVDEANRCLYLVAPGGGEPESCPERERLLFARPPQLLVAEADGRPLLVINNHWKSKRGGELETRPRREAQARFVAGLVREARARIPGIAIIVIGDLNDGLESWPLRHLHEGAALVNLWARLPVGERYSYIFQGVSEPLDHVLVDPALSARVVSFAPLHIHADLPATVRPSDHDPLLLEWR